MSKHYHLKFFLFSILIFSLFAALANAQEKPSGELAKSYVAYLADDALEGRDTGTPGFDKAAKWVADHYKSWGLIPAGDNGSYIQNFPFSFYKSDFDEPQLFINKRKFYHEDRDFRVIRYSGGGSVKGEVVFVGYGISSEADGLDEYAGIDVNDKIVLFMHGFPGEDEERWGDLRTDSAKVATAIKHGASGALICANFNEEERGVGYWRLRPGNYKSDFIIYGVDERVVKALLKQKNETRRGFNRRLEHLMEKLDVELKPVSALTGKIAKLKVKTEFNPEKPGKNVLGMIKGADPEIGDEVIVIGAHLDHLGIKYNLIYNGADDNATGSAVVMEVARVMMKNKIQPKRTIIFACWGGEERGLLGSRYYAKHPTIPIDKTVLNFNLDMVGIGDKLGFPGIYYAPNVWKIIKENISEEMLEFIQPRRGGPGGSDHTPFITRGVPAFALMTSPWNAHTDYHQPGDDIEKIDAELMDKVANFVYDNTLLIANQDGDLITENRLELYIHKSAIIANMNPYVYEEKLHVLDSLKNEWIDIQFFEVSLDSIKSSTGKTAGLVWALDAASREKSNSLGSGQSVSRMFSSRNASSVSVIGLRGAESVSHNLANIRIAEKLGAKFFIFDGVDGKWISDEEGLTKAGKKAIKEMNKAKMLIFAQDLPESVLLKIMDVSRHPVIIAGKFDITELSKKFTDSLKKNEGLLALGFCPGKENEKIADNILTLKETIDLKYLGIYPGYGKRIDFQHLDLLFNLTLALKAKGFNENQIKQILGNNLRRVFEKIIPSQRGQGRWRF